ncbi:MAG: hypothetical protein EDX89_07265 [Acidobacteria bacterium]|nr:MAG: hypothetical protein EDX89_07265 [Acidobacteriota bacterium]
MNDSIRPERLTWLPTTPYLARVSEPMFPTTTSPVLSAIPISRGGRPSAALRSLTPSIASCISMAQATARRASSGPGIGAPNRARIASPMNSSIVPRYRAMIRVIVPR